MPFSVSYHGKSWTAPRTVTSRVPLAWLTWAPCAKWRSPWARRWRWVNVANWANCFLVIDDIGCKLNTLKYEVSRMGTPLGVNSGVLTWVAEMIVEPCPPPPPHCRTLEVLVPGAEIFWYCNLLFPTTLDFYGSCGSSYLENLVPIVLGTVQSAWNSCHWNMCHFGSRISTCVYKHSTGICGIFIFF